MARKPMGPPPAKAAGGKRKGKALVPPLKGAALPPARPTRGRIALALPVVGVAERRRPGPPPPRGGPPPRMMPSRGAPPELESSRVERLEGDMPPRRAQAMSALRRGKVAF